MARTIVVPSAPSGMATPSIDLVDSGDVVVDSITLVEATNRKGRYTGTIDGLTGAAVYHGVVKSGASSVGAFEAIEVTAADPSTVTVRDRVHSSLDFDITLPGQEAAPATLKPLDILRWLYKAWRNKFDQSATEHRLYANDGTTVDQKRSLGESGGIATIGKIESGP